MSNSRPVDTLQNAGEPSRRPIPDRTLHQPSRLSVAHRNDQTGQLDEAGPSDVEALRKDLHRRAELARKAEKWSDRLMEDTLDRRTVKKALSYLNPRQYSDILHERHLNSLCSYPACTNGPLAPYTSARRFKISTTNRTIREQEGNEEEGFCSRKCQVRSKWIEDQLGESPVWAREKGRDRGGLKLLEELEEEAMRERAAAPGLNGDQPTTVEIRGLLDKIPQPATQTKKALPDGRDAKPIVPTTANGNGSELSAPALPTALPPSKPPPPLQKIDHTPTSKTPSSSAVSDLLSNLTILERPTPTAPPVAPSLTQPSPSIPPAATASASSAASGISDQTAMSRRKAGASLVQTPSKLTSTLLSVSRQMGPLPQMAPDSDEEEEQDKDWGEEEMGLTWGEEDDDIRALFAEAQAARDLLEES